MRTGLHDDEIIGRAYDIRLMRRLLTYVRPYKKKLALLLLVAVTLLQLAGPYLVKVAIDSYILRNDWPGLNFIIAVYFAVLLLAFLLQYVQVYVMQLSGQLAMSDMRVALFSHLQKMSLSFFNRVPLGRIVTRVVNDVETLNEMFTQGIVVAVGDLLTLIAIVIALVSLDARLAFLTVLVVFPLLYATKLYRDRARHTYRNIRANAAKLNSCVQENVSGMSTVQVFNRQAENFKRFDRINKENRDEQLKSLTYYAVYFPLIEVFSAIAIGIIIWYGGGEAVRGRLQLGVLVAFIQYVQRFFQPIKDFSEKYNILQAAMASSERIFALLDTPEEISNSPRPVVVPELKGEIEFQDVWFSYNGEDPVLKGVSFHLKPGESLAVVGATGAGKTSIINLIARFYEIQRGKILIDGVDIRKLDKGFLRRQIGIVFQDPFLFAGDVENNIRLGELSIPQEKVYEAAREVNAHAFIEKLPRGYRESVQERGSTLSLGQKQLLSFARAMAFDPKILILDEATSSVDTETEANIRDAVAKLIRGRTSIIIAHRLSTIRYAERILVIDKGKIAEMGRHEELLKKEGIYHKLYRLQFRGH
jgi:ATP-binding cassette subfamily B protein